MSPSLSLPIDSSHHFGQFRIGTLLLITAVFALVAAIARFSFPVGVVATVPLTVALLRTLRVSGRNQGKLPMLFFASLLILVSLASLTALSIALGVTVIALTLLQIALRVLHAVTDWVRVRSTGSAANGGGRRFRFWLIRMTAATMRSLHGWNDRVRLLVQAGCARVGKATIRKVHVFNA